MTDQLPTESIEDLTDSQLLARYFATSQEIGDPEVERLIPEMAKRTLEF